MAHLLDRIDSPDQVRRFSIPELEELAAEIRDELITVLSANGGHLGPNLGVVELTLALWGRVWDSLRWISSTTS